MSTYRISTRTFRSMLERIHLRRGWAFGMIILGALIAFEMFNYSTTEYALSDLLGDLRFAGLRWATILAIAFCGIDFAGYARLHTPEEGSGKPHETWYLFGAWLLAATMNAMLTWWGVSLAIANHTTLGNVVVERETLLKAVPIFVAVLVWSIRVLIIGTFATAGTRLITQREQRTLRTSRPSATKQETLPAADSQPLAKDNSRPASPARPFSSRINSDRYQTSSSGASDPATNTVEGEAGSVYSRPEPVYTPIQSASSTHSSTYAKENNSPYPIKPVNNH